MNRCLIAVVYACVAYEFVVFLPSFDFPFMFFFRGTHTVNRTVKGRTCVRFLTLPWFLVHVFSFRETLYKSYSCQGRSSLRFLTQRWFPVYVFFRGTQTINLTVTSGGPLPFAYDILTTAFQYGNRVFTKYPKDIPDYFKQSFPEGYSWERHFEYEDGGKCDVKSVIRLVKSKTCSAPCLSRLSRFHLWYIIAFMHAFLLLLLLDSVFLFKLCFKLELRKALFQNSFRKKETKKRKTRNFYLSFM